MESEARNCRKCGIKMPQKPNKTGPAPSYCSKKCRRAAEFELRRLHRAIERAEERCVHYQLQAAGLCACGGSREYGEQALAWWTGQVERLEARLRELLADGSVKVSPS
jgi:hypothetical protein